jgi:hypothetical protein
LQYKSRLYALCLAFTCQCFFFLQVVQAYTDAYGRQTSMIITPTVVKETQAQVRCYG